MKKGQRTNQKYRNLVRSDQQMQKLEKTELRKADRTVGVNFNVLSNISSGTAGLLQGMFRDQNFEKKTILCFGNL